MILVEDHSFIRKIGILVFVQGWGNFLRTSINNNKQSLIPLGGVGLKTSINLDL